VAGRVQRLQRFAAESQRVAMLQLHDRRADVAACGHRGLRARVLGQARGAGDVVGMGVRLQRPAQREPQGLQYRQVTVELLVHRVDDGGLARGRVVQHVGI